MLAAAGVPLALFAILYGLIPETRAAKPPLRAPSGEAVLAPAAPPDALPINAELGQNITLTAVRPPEISRIVPGEPSAIELDWRVAGSVPSDVDIVVSFESGGAHRAEADHQLISAALRFTDAPRGVTLRDIVPFVFPATAGNGTLDVWVGLRDGATHRPQSVSAPNSTTRADGSVLAASLRLN